MTDGPCDADVRAGTAAAARDREFWQNFFRYRTLCFRMCVRWLRGNHHDAEDALSRGALRALDFYRRHPERVGSFRPWMLRLLHNLCADIREAQDRMSELPGEEDEAAAALASTAAEPERALYARELRGVITHAVADLPAWLYAVFRLRLVDEVPYPDICAQFHISPENARQRIQQARRRLRGHLVPFT
jgi:RNA polymerase sigma-70 factor (ECF subfamily)